jgi:hypothetical protein
VDPIESLSSIAFEKESELILIESKAFSNSLSGMDATSANGQLFDVVILIHRIDRRSSRDRPEVRPTLFPIPAQWPGSFFSL